MTTDTIDRQDVKLAIKHALRPDPKIQYDGSRKWSARVYDRLTTLAIYSCADKRLIPRKSFMYLQMWSQGQDYDQVAIQMATSAGAVGKGVSRALDFIIEQIPLRLLKYVPAVFHPPMRECPRDRCGGQLLWNGFEGEYECILCSRHFTSDLRQVGH